MSWKRELEKRVRGMFQGLRFEFDELERAAIVDGKYVAALPDDDTKPGLWVLEMLPDGEHTKFLGVIEAI